MSVPFGMHDREGAIHVPQGGWCLDLVSLNDDPSPRSYNGGINWLVRLDWGYHGKGTLPQPQDLPTYFNHLSAFVARTKGAHTFIIGNEPNHPQEYPDGAYISPQYYADTYNKAYGIIKGMSSSNRVAPGAVAPYRADPIPWNQWQIEALSRIIGADSLCGHAYAKGSHPSAIWDETKMADAPLTGLYYGFKTYRDMFAAVPGHLRHLPVDFTEFDEDLPDGWLDQNTGIVRAAYAERAWWNAQAGNQHWRSLILYRYPHHDKFYIEGKQGVLDDFYAAIAESSQDAQEGQGEEKRVTLMPSIKNEPKTPPSPSTGLKRDIDPEAIARGVTIDYLPDSTAGYKVMGLEWLDVQESQGRHHIYYDVIDPAGNRVVAKDFIRVKWGSGFDDIDCEAKPGEPYNANFAMSSSRNDYSTWINNHICEKVSGIGMGADLGGGFNASEHTSTAIVYRWVAAIEGTDEEGESPPSQELALQHPVSNPRWRTITQEFGDARGAYTTRDGRYIQGHTGIDFATPLNSEIVNVDTGQVIEAGFDATGYGNYVKMRHPWGESLYAHLSESRVREGEIVERGEEIGLSGTTGNSTGPHLHFATRRYPYNRNDGWDGFSDPKPYLNQDDKPVKPTPPKDAPIAAIIAQEADNLGFEDVNLLLSLAWAESSFRPQIMDGIFQIGDLAWSDYADAAGATDKNNARDNVRVGILYLEWLMKQFPGNLDKALVAWNFGIQNVLDGEPVPAITNEFVNKVKHGRDLLDAVGY